MDIPPDEVPSLPWDNHIYIHTCIFGSVLRLQNSLSRALKLWTNIGRFALSMPSTWPSLLFSPAFTFKTWNRKAKLARAFNCTLPKLYKFTRLLDLCGRFAGNFGCICAFQMRNDALDMNGLSWPWDGARMQAMFNFIQCLKCGDRLATRKQNYRQTSRRDLAKLGHTPNYQK